MSGNNGKSNFTHESAEARPFTGECKACGWKMDGIIHARSYEMAATKILGAHNLEKSDECKKPNIAIKPA